MLAQEHSSVSTEKLKNSTPWMKRTLVICSIKQQQNKLCNKTKRKKSKET